MELKSFFRTFQEIFATPWMFYFNMHIQRIQKIGAFFSFIFHTWVCMNWHVAGKWGKAEMKLIQNRKTLHETALCNYLCIYFTLNHIFRHKSLCQNVNECQFNFNNAHYYGLLLIECHAAQVLHNFQSLIAAMARRVVTLTHFHNHKDWSAVATDCCEGSLPMSYTFSCTW